VERMVRVEVDEKVSETTLWRGWWRWRRR